MFLFISRFRDSSANAESKDQVIQQVVPPVRSRVRHKSTEITQQELCPDAIREENLAKYLSASEGTYSAFRGFSESQSDNLAHAVDPGSLRIHYYPITQYGINMIELGRYFTELQKHPDFQDILKNLGFETEPYIFAEEAETAVCRPMPFENIQSVDVVRPDGRSYDRVMSKTFKEESVKRLIFLNWESWLTILKNRNLLRGGQ